MAKTRGATSFSQVSLQSLNEVFANKTVVIPVSRIFLRKLGLIQNSELAPKAETKNTKNTEEKENSVPFNVIQ